MSSPQSLPQDFAEAVVRVAGRLAPFGRQIMWYADVPSTNDLAARLAERGVQEGCVIAANAQSSGRGRQGRVWSSPPGAGLYVSAVLRPPSHVIPLLTILAGVAVAEGVQASTGLAPCLKWPNDVYAGQRKLAGILAEAGVSTTGEPYVVLGFGINVMAAAYPLDVAARATSIETELGRAVDRGLVFAECLASLASRYAQLRNTGAAAVLAAWRARAASMLGRGVEWDTNGTAARGVAENIDDTGALLVRTATGTVRVISGEIRWG